MAEQLAESKVLNIDLNKKGAETDLLITLAYGAILSTVKNPKSKQKVKAINLKIYNAIKTAYAGDPDFE